MSSAPAQNLISAAVTKMLVCLDEATETQFAGRLFSPFLPQVVPFKSFDALLEAMEQFFDEIGFPQAFYSTRHFAEKDPTPRSRSRSTTIPRYHDDEVFATLRGTRATLTVQVATRHHASWQGTALWLEHGKRQSFGSMLALLRLMTDAAAGTTTGWDSTEA